MELDDAATWYERERRGLGGEFLAALLRTLATVRETPDASPRIAQRVRRALIRRFPYAIIFEPVDDRINVLAIMHVHRRPGYWRARR